MSRPAPRSTLFPYTTLFRSTHSRANSLGQYLFVNGRPVRDKLLIGVIRGAYADYLSRDRHPVDRKSTRLNSSHQIISYAVFCLKKKTATPVKGSIKLAEHNT